MLLQSHPRAQISKPHFTVKDHLHPVDLPRVAISLCPFIAVASWMSVQEILRSLCKNGKNPTVQS